MLPLRLHEGSGARPPRATRGRGAHREFDMLYFFLYFFNPFANKRAAKRSTGHARAGRVRGFFEGGVSSWNAPDPARGSGRGQSRLNSSTMSCHRTASRTRATCAAARRPRPVRATTTGEAMAPVRSTTTGDAMADAKKAQRRRSWQRPREMLAACPRGCAARRTSAAP